MTDLVTGWTENHSVRNNASKWICATVSASITPGRSGFSSEQVRVVIELRSSGEGFVVEMPLMRIVSRAGLR
ncbi:MULTISPECIES: hypothetical protein [Mycobacterium]|uniref:hypothetical protein n=1 Tax=Mycobacterium TaxID=1763 RepID=UPI001EDD743F|nr:MULTISPECIES: hypothetical protein [Mycobacterium]